MLKREMDWLRRLLAGCTLALIAAPAAIAQGPKPPPAKVAVAAVEEAEVTRVQSFVGTVIPYRHSIVGAPIDGRVEERSVEVGDVVKPGDTLVQLRTKQIDMEVAEARSTARLRRRELAELERSRPLELDRAKARQVSTKLVLQHSKSRLKRLQELYKNNTATLDEVQDAENNVAVAEQNFIEAQAALHLVEGGEEKIEQAEARAQAQDELVERLEDRQDKHTLRAPFHGFVAAIHTEIGQWLRQGEPAAEIVELDRVYVEAEVPESEIRHLVVGQTARVMVDALADKLFVGQIERISPKADPRSRSFPVRVTLKNQLTGGTPLLKAGMFARAALPVGERETAVVVPKDAVVLGGRKPVVFVATSAEEGQTATVQLVEVELGAAAEDRVAIRGNIEAGSFVVVAGNERLRPGQEVVITEQVKSRVAAGK